jgi:hypothetical protein
VRSSYPHHYTNGILNLSNFVLTNIQKRILHLGHSFITKPANFDQIKTKKQLSRIIGNKSSVDSILSDINIPTALKNLNLAEKKALDELQRNEDVVITLADKGDTWVLMNRDDYIWECDRQLKDNSVYRSLQGSEILQNAMLYRNTLLLMSREKQISRRQLDLLLPKDDKYKERIFYTLPKIHKARIAWSKNGKIPPGRPIIGNTNSEDTEISKYITTFLQPIVSKQPHILKNSEEILAALHDVTLNGSSILFSLDVNSLYTNIPLIKGLQVVQTFFEKNPDPKRPDKYLLELLKLSLLRNDFVFNGKNYRQIKGVAMGKQYSPAFANLYMSDWERKVLHEVCGEKPTMYFRYIDDIFGIWEGTIENLVKFVNLVNAVDENIQVTLCSSFTDVQFLDIIIFKDTNLKLATTVYLKPSSSLRLIGPRSLHPNHTKHGIILSQILRYIKNTTYQSDFFYNLHLLLQSLRKQGYSRSTLRKIKQKAFRISNFHIRETGEILKGFYPCESKCKSCVNHGVRKHHIQFYGGQKMISQYITCTTKNVVYAIHCLSCQKYYVGETRNSVKQRISQHLSTIKLKRDTPVSKHFSSENHTINDFSYFVIAHNPYWTVQKRRLVENQWINKMKSLAPNGINMEININYQRYITVPYKGRLSIPHSLSGVLSDNIKTCFTNGKPLRVILNQKHRIARRDLMSAR